MSERNPEPIATADSCISNIYTTEQAEEICRSRPEMLEAHLVSAKAKFRVSRDGVWQYYHEGSWYKSHLVCKANRFTIHEASSKEKE